MPRNIALDFWECNGHYHRRIDGLMANPYTYEVLPDQWCKKGQKKVSEVYWCDVGDHPFPATDENSESYSRTRKVKSRNEYTGRLETVEMTEELHVCGQHVGSAFQPKAINGTVVSEGGDT